MMDAAGEILASENAKAILPQGLSAAWPARTFFRKR